MTTHPTSLLYAAAKIGAETKYQQANELINLTLDGVKISYIEIAEMQKCAAILDDFAHELYSDPAMWEHPADASPDTLAAMQLRSNEISAALKGDDLSTEERESLWQELSGIATWIEREYTYLSDVSDVILCRKFGEQL